MNGTVRLKHESCTNGPAQYNTWADAVSSGLVHGRIGAGPCSTLPDQDHFHMLPP